MRALDADTLRQRACTELLRQAALQRRPAAGRRCALTGRRHQRGGHRRHRNAARTRAGVARAVRRSLPPTLRRAPRALSRRRPRVGAPRAVCGDAGGGRAQAARPRRSCLLELRCHRDGDGDRFPAVAAELSNCPSAAQGGSWAGCARRTARRNSRASSSPALRSACCRGWCTAASACTWSKCWHARPAPHPVRSSAWRRGAGTAPADLRHRAAPVPAAAGGPGPCRRRGTRQRRHAAGAMIRKTLMDIHHFDDLLQMARMQSEPQQLLFVFAGAELPAQATAQQRADFESGEGGELAPLMCVDKPATALQASTRWLPKRRKPARPGPSSSAPRCRAAAVNRRALPTPRQPCNTWSNRSRPADSTACCLSRAPVCRCNWAKTSAIMPDVELGRDAVLPVHSSPEALRRTE